MSRPITITIPHQLGAAEARRRLEQGFVGIQQQIAGASLAQLKCDWRGDQADFSARALGQAITGRIEVLAEAVNLEIHLPRFLAMLADKVRGRVQTEGKLLLEKK